jgi:hypothetical protein
LRKSGVGWRPSEDRADRLILPYRGPLAEITQVQTLKPSVVPGASFFSSEDRGQGRMIGPCHE